VLETEFTCDGGVVRIIDFMPRTEGSCDLIRIIEGVDGQVPMEMILNVRFGFGAYVPWISPDPQGRGLCFVAGPDALVVRGPFQMTPQGGRALGYFTVKKGDRIPLELRSYPSHTSVPGTLDAEKKLAETETLWKDWASRCTCEGEMRDLVMRSLITLKALIYEPTGGIVAAPTTSLPEAIGGVRNWDYRYCWLRDASLTLDALMMGGYSSEATRFRDWLLRAVAGAPDDLQIMYDLFGARRLTEYELDWLPGYEGSKPVRVGNAASGQFQLDVYGESMSCIYAARKLGMAKAERGWAVLKDLLSYVERIWQEPDDGIWEVRGGRRHFTHSKMMAWVAVDRAIKAIEELGEGGEEGTRLLPHYRALRDRIHAEVCERAFNPKMGAFTQSYGSDALDAAVLLMPESGFLDASDPRVQGTVKAIEKNLLREGFVLRYNTEHGNDGLPGNEGAFLACSFWLADNYALGGRMEEAEELFQRLLGLRNHLGLLAEEYEPDLGRQVGNFPQAFSHLALIFTARHIDQCKQQQSKRKRKGNGPVVHA
jgi:GH15 family glucan-1,4-alpha-glucosidase